jgi:DNA-binding CsgD family transcriptional regulator/tetratricopeptide (TPR) repeat protein
LSQEQPFVGRESELRQLEAAFEIAAGSGHGRLIMLVGEPGIGKTALCEQLSTFVSVSGGLSLIGHCYEGGSFRLPYQPFVEVLASYLHGLDTQTLSAELGSSASDLARIIPMLRERLHVTPPQPGDPEEDRWRLLQAATDLLRNTSAKRQPLLVVLEDLHDADRGTLDLLLYLSRNLHGARILVVGTYRDVEVDRAHPLSAALTELHRASNVARMQLHGLSSDEVQRLLAETSHQTVPQPFAELVHRQTEGNPLFVRETLNFVIDAGLVEKRDGGLRRVGQDNLAVRIPEGLRDAVGKRLSRLTEICNRVLSVASVIGREFQLDVLRRVLGCPEDELEVALSEALAVGIIEERSVVGTTITFRFGHAFFRQTLYEEIVAPRRIRLHQQVAHALEHVHHRRLDEHAAELAEHFAFSSDTEDLAKAVHYGQMAARRATEMFAYGEAARLLERALIVQELADPDDKTTRCDLLLAMGEALVPSGETERAITQIAPDAFGLAQALGDRERAFRTCRLAFDCLESQAQVPGIASAEYRRWAEEAGRFAEPDSVQRVEADLALANAWEARGQLQGARALRLEALALARQHQQPETLFRSAFFLMYSGAPQRWAERLRLSEESTGWPRQGARGRSVGSALWMSGMIQLAEGERARAEQLWREVGELAGRIRLPIVSLRVPQSEVILAIVDGHLEEAVDLLRRYVERADHTDAVVRGRFQRLQMLHAPALYLGRPEVWLAAFEEYARLAGQTSPTVMALYRAICLAQLGHLGEARALVGRTLDRILRDIDENEWPIGIVARLLQAAIFLDDRDTARAACDRLACVAHLAIGDFFYTCVARHLGDGATLLGDRVAARAYYMQALESAGKIRFRPELALSHLGLAELMVKDADDGTRFEALEHLEIALPELRDMKMQPAVERGQALRETLAPAAAVATTSESASDTLTAREREIASLMADGLSNHDIAERLVITEGTVEVHVKHILSKLGLRSRTQVAGWVARQGPG